MVHSFLKRGIFWFFQQDDAYSPRCSLSGTYRFHDERYRVWVSTHSLVLCGRRLY